MRRKIRGGRMLSFILAASLALSAPLSVAAAGTEEIDVSGYIGQTKEDVSETGDTQGDTASVETGSSDTDAAAGGTGYIPIDDGFVPQHAEDAADMTEGELSVDRAAALPAVFDGSERVTFDFYDQGETNTCWAYAALEACRINADMKGLKGKQTDLSADEYAYYFFNKGEDVSDLQGNETGDYARQETGLGYLNAGGNGRLGMWQLASWMGPVADTGSSDHLGSTQAVYGNDVLHVQNVLMANTADIDNVKDLIYTYGGVSVGYYAETGRDAIASYDSFANGNEYDDGHSKNYGNYYCPDEKAANHNVLLIGWDDNYKKENFVQTPSSDGAWLVLNSWGGESDQVAQNGMFWLSYEDAGLTGSKVGLAFDVEDSDNYQHNYQYDGSFGIQTVSNVTKAVQLFKLGSDEAVKAFSVGVEDANVSYKAEIFKLSESVDTFDESWVKPLFDDGQSITCDGKNVTASCIASTAGTFSYGGYHTVKLSQPTTGLKAGTVVAVVLTFDAPAKVFTDTTCTVSNYWGFTTAKTDAFKGYGKQQSTEYGSMADHETLRIKMFTDDKAADEDTEEVENTISFGKDAYELSVGKSITPDYTVTVDGKNAADYTVVFSSSDENIVKVDKNSGKVTAMSAGGPVTLTAVLKDRDGNDLASGSCSVTVVDAADLVKELRMDKEMTLTRGNEKKIICQTVPSVKLPEGSIKWSSSDEKIAAVDKNGNVTAVSVGTADITASVGDGIKAACSVSVVSPYKSIQIAEDGKKVIYKKVKMGTESVLLVSAVMASDNSSVSGAPAVFSSSDAEVVSITSAGEFRALKAGSATITAELDGMKAYCTIIVEEKAAGGNAGGESSDPDLPGGSVEDIPDNGEYFSVVVANDSVFKKILIGKENHVDVKTVSANGIEVPYDDLKFTCDGEYVTADGANLIGLKGGSGKVKMAVTVDGKRITREFYVTVVPDTDGSYTTDDKKDHDNNNTADDGGVNADPKKDIVNKAPEEIKDTTPYIKRITLKTDCIQISPVKGSTKITALIGPAEVDKSKVEWFSSNNKYAAVTQDGLVKAKKAGAGHTVVITCQSTDGSGAVGSIAIRIVPDYIEKMYLTVKNSKGKAVKKQLSVNSGDKAVLETTYKTTGKDTVKKLVYTSSNTEWAKVDEKGNVKFFKAGRGHTVKITAVTKDGAKKASYKFYIRKKQNITVAKKYQKVLKLKAGTLKKKAKTLKLKAGTDGNGKPLSYEVVKAPKNAASYIKVSKKGVVTIKKGAPKGTYKIRITARQTKKYMEGRKTVTIKVK